MGSTFAFPLCLMPPSLLDDSQRWAWVGYKMIKVKGSDGWPETTRSNTGHSPVLYKPPLGKVAWACRPCWNRRSLAACSNFAFPLCLMPPSLLDDSQRWAWVGYKTIKVKGSDGWPETTRSNTGHSPVLHKPPLGGVHSANGAPTHSANFISRNSRNIKFTRH